MDDLLCPKRIETSDFKNYLEKKLTRHELELFNKCYKPVDSDTNGRGACYRLEIDFAASHGSHTKSMCDDLNKLVRIMFNHFGDECNDSGGENLRLKYLKSVQQDELELLTRPGLADPNMIVWVHLVSGGENVSATAAAAATTPGLSELNKARYALMFDLLKDNVLNHNYKQIRVSEPTSTAEDTQLLDSIVEFLYNSIKLIVDAITLELDKISVGVMSLSK